MADSKEFLIGNKAKDLLIYTYTVTKPVSEKTLETKDVLGIMLKMHDMDQSEVKKFCEETSERLRRTSDKQGFPKSAVHTYIRLARQTVVDIMVNIQMANDCRFDTEYERRLELIDAVLKGCNLMLQVICISLELGYINVKRSKHWTKMVTDVKYMTLSWKKKDGDRAKDLRKADDSKRLSQLSRAMSDGFIAALREHEQSKPN